ncbi:MAG: tRNA lysidine(34) synthetase TilS [Opitutales bacterium]|nr:tRNA lysidine(34) synthetase TilS [Opitutales bacterium]
MTSLPQVPANLSQKAKEVLEIIPETDWHPQVIDLLSAHTNETWVVACSGGADSLMTLLLIHASLLDKQVRLVVVHFNHNLRGDNSRNDALFVEEVARVLNIEVVIGLAEKNDKIDEGTLREQRRSFYRAVMKTKSASVLIQGHNLDDVAETFLWRIARGVGVDGISAPKPVQELEGFHVVRPLLSVPRDFIRQSLQSAKIQWREDSTNEDNYYLRNRIRKNTLAQWKKDSDRDLLKGVGRTRDLLEEQGNALEELAQDALHQSLDSGNLICNKLEEYPRGLLRKVITLWLTDNMKLAAVHQYHLDEILDSLTTKADFKITISSSFTLVKKGNMIMEQPVLSKSFEWETIKIPFKLKIFLPRHYFLFAEVISLNPETRSAILSGKVDQSENAFINFECSPIELFLRSRCTGDRFTPLGAPGSKKVKDWMIDRNWSNDRKNRTPIVVNSSGQIVWIPGFPPASNYAITGSVSQVIRLTYRESASL